MMGLGGVDQQIQERVDAYRGNPQQLMQRYQQNQQLIDLLALQKLKSEKDAAAREMQMKMQTTPQTIKDQREAEMLQRTKDELVQQTTGIMQQRQRQQQQNMQRTANQGLPQLPAGNMQKMAGGGIVSFAEGGPLRQEDVDAELNRKIELALQMGASVEQIAEKLKDNPRALSMLRSKTGGMEERPEPRGIMSPRLASEAGMVSGPLAPPPTPKEGGIFDFLKPKPRENQAELDAFRAKGDAARAAEQQRRAENPPYNPFAKENTGPINIFAKDEEPTQEAVPATKTASTPAPERKPAQQMDQLQEIDTSGLAGLRKQNLRPEDIPTDTDLTINQLKKALAEQNDPEKLRRERLRNFLLGAAGGTSISSALAGAGMRSSAVGKAQEQARLKGIEQLAGMQGAKVKNEIEARSAKALEDIRAAQNETQRFSALASAAQSNTESLQALMLTDEKYLKAEKRLKEAEEGGWLGPNENKVREARLALNAELQRLKDSIQGYDFVSNAYQAMLQKFQGATSAAEPTSGANDSQFKVQQISK